MSEVALQMSHSVDADVSRDFAWRWRTDLRNWNDPPAVFAIDGPFVSGMRGVTTLPGREPIVWHLRDVLPDEQFVVEMQLDGAVLRFEWRFSDLPESRTKMTQTIVLSGENAAAYTAQIEAGFRPTLADGMKRIAADLEAAAKL